MEENTFKACPKYNTPIEKADGCNHIICSSFSTDFCWIYLGIFDRGQIYDHVNAKHGTIGIKDENVDRDGEGNEGDLGDERWRL